MARKDRSHLEDDEEYIIVSKSELKRDMDELKVIGSRLIDMKQSMLDKLPLEDRLRRALDESKRITSFNARKRHLGYIGKLLKEQDLEPITILLNSLDSSSEEFNRRFHQLERWRDRLINEGPKALTEYLVKYPDADHQHIRQLVRNAQKEVKLEKPPASSKKLFKFLREVDGL